MIGLKEIHRQRSSNNAKTSGNESPDPLTWRPLFSNQFFHLCRNKSQNPGLQLAQGVYQEVLSKTEVLHLWPAYKWQKSLIPSWEGARRQARQYFPGAIKEILYLYFQSYKDQDPKRGNHCHWEPWVTFVPKHVSVSVCVVELWLYPEFVSSFVHICV